MQAERSDLRRDVLPYGRPDLRPTRRAGRLLACLSALCIAVPYFGLAIRSGPLFLPGLPLSLVGVVLSVSAFVIRLKASRVSVLTTIGNAINAACFGWLFFVSGIC